MCITQEDRDPQILATRKVDLHRSLWMSTCSPWPTQGKKHLLWRSNRLKLFKITLFCHNLWLYGGFGLEN